MRYLVADLCEFISQVCLISQSSTTLATIIEQDKQKVAMNVSSSDTVNTAESNSGDDQSKDKAVTTAGEAFDEVFNC